MSSKGEKKKLKSLNAPRAVHIKRKENKWTIRTSAGAYKKEDSVALGIVLRDFIGVAVNLREAKEILKKGEIKVNGKIKTEHKFGVGLFDIISIENQEKEYRVVYDKKRRVILKELKNKSNEKISKIMFKRITKKGIQITTNEGMVFIGAKGNVGDSLKIKVPEGKIEELIELKEGALIYITKGSHCSEKGRIKEIVKGTAKREKLVKIEQEKREFETLERNVIVIGEKEEAIKDLKEI